MDEPFGALDPVIRGKAQEDLLAIQRRLGTTIVLVTHDMNEAFHLGDRIAVMDQARLLQYAAPAELLTHPADAFVEQLAGTAERPFRLLSLIRVQEAVEPGGAEGDAAFADDHSARCARAADRGSASEALPVIDASGTAVGRISVERHPGAWAASRMSARGLILRAAALLLLVAFITAPQLFAFAFAPLTVNDAPAIYNQGSLLVAHPVASAHGVSARRWPAPCSRSGSASSSRGPRARNSCRCRAAS